MAKEFGNYLLVVVWLGLLSRFYNFQTSLRFSVAPGFIAFSRVLKLGTTCVIYHPRCSLKMKVCGPHFRPVASESLGLHPRNQHFQTSRVVPPLSSDVLFFLLTCTPLIPLSGSL